MRTTLLLFAFAAPAVTGCSRAENAPNPPVAAADTPPNPNPAPEPTAGKADPDPPPPPKKDEPAGVPELLAAVAKFGGYENRFGKRAGDPLHIHFRDPGAKDADLEQLSPVLLRASVPLKLNLNGSRSITDAGIAHLRGVTTIRVLQIESKAFTDEGMKHLAGHTQLEELSVSGTVTDAGLAHLAKLTNLKKLSVYSKGTTDAGYRHLAGLVNLEEVHVGDVGHAMSDECLGHMSGMTKLKAVTLSRDKLTDAGMAHVKNFTELRELRVETGRVTGAALANLAPLKKLQKLTISVAGVTGDSLAPLAGLTELRALELNASPYVLDKVGGAHLGKLTGLKVFRTGRVTGGAMEGLAGLTALEEFDLGNVLDGGVTDADLKHIGALTALRTLYLNGMNITDAGTAHLTGLAKLRDLSVSDGKLTDASLAHFAALPDLKLLGLTNGKITGAGLKHLAKLTKLERIWLNGNPVTDEYVMALKEIPALKWVNLTGSKVSDDVALGLKKVRPKLDLMDAAGDDVTLNPKPPRPKRPPAADITKIEPAFKLTAEEFHKEYKAGREQAAAKFKGKVVEVSGTVDGITRNDDGECFLTLKVDKELIGVWCSMAEERPWARALKGQKVRIKGQWPEKQFLAALTSCVFVDAGEYMGITIDPAALATEFAADPAATAKKYDGKWLVVSGAVAEKEFNSAGAAGVVLKTDGKVKVKCNFTASDKDFTKPLKVGQTIKVVGEFTFNFGSKDEVVLYFCLPLPGP